MPPPNSNRIKPPKKATKVHDLNSISSSDTLSYPTTNELNAPPSSFDGYVRCIFGAKGSGKSTLASQFPKTLTLMFEPRRRNLVIRQLNLLKTTPQQIMEGAPDIWQLIKNTTQQWIDDESIDNLAFDSVDIAYECCYSHICAKHGVKAPNDAGKAGPDMWNEIRDEWGTYFDTLTGTRLGITFVSHVKVRENEELDGSKFDRKSPSCTPACLRYIKQAVDFVFFYGKLNGKRCMQIRDDDGMAEVAAGAQGHFLQPDGKPIYYLEMPDLLDKKTGYQVLCEAFNNQHWDLNTPIEERTVTSAKKGPPNKKAS